MKIQVTRNRSSAAFHVWMLVWAFSIFRCGSVLAQTTTPTYVPGDYRTATSGMLGQAGGTALLEQLTADNTWASVAYPIPANATVYVRHAVQIENTLEVDKLIVSTQQTTITSSAALIANSTLSVSAGATLLMQGDIHVKGTLKVEANAKLVIKSASYQGLSTLWAGIEQLDPASEVRLEEVAPKAVLFSPAALTTQTNGFLLGKLTIAFSSGNTQWQLVDGSATLASSAVSFMIPSSSSLTLAPANSQISFGQGLALAGGTFYGQNQVNGTVSIAVGQDLQLTSNAVLQLNQTASSTAITLFDLKGNLLLDNTSSIINSAAVNTSSSGIKLSGTDWQTLNTAGPINHVSLTVKTGSKARLANNLSLNSSNSVYAGTVTVENGASLDFGADAAGNGYAVTGQGYFKADLGSTLYITSAQGINATGTMGNVQVTDTRRTFNQLATFVYSGLVPQQTGNVFTTTGSGKIVVIDNPTSVTLTNSINITSNTTLAADGGRLEIRQGKFIGTATADVTGTGKLVMRGGVYQVQVVNVQVPQLTGTHDITAGTVELAGNGTQTLKGGTYPAVIISGNNTLGTSAKTISSTTTITQNLTILPNAILDASTKSLKGDGGLTMTGGTLRLARTTATLPELTGNNNPYSLTGGTIEFYGSLNGQYQSIRGTYGASKKITYHHLQLNAAQANTTDGGSNIQSSANFDVAGTLTLNAPAVFQVASNRTIAGTGNFMVLPGATLLYGSPQGIKTSGTGTLDGNIRVSGTRTFSSEANYGFIGASEMVSGNGLPATVVNLLVSKTGSGVTLTNSVAVTGTFTLKSGTFKTDSKELYMVNSSTSAVVVADPTFYIQGNLRRAIATTGTYQFPIGTATGKRMLELTSNELTGNGFQNILVGFNPLISHQDSDMLLEENGYYYTSMQPDGVWTLEPNALPASGSYTAVASLQGFSNLTDNQFALLVRPKTSVSGKDWRTGGGMLEGPNKDGRTVSSGYAKRAFMTQFGQLGIANATAGTLPVSWLYVTGKRTQHETVIEWATATEKNNDRFEVQYSLDGKTFTNAGTVKAAGNSNTIQKYRLFHTLSADQITYYRIKQIDTDGAFELSKVISVNGSKTTQLVQLSLYPNPTHEELFVHGLTLATNAKVEIYNATGQKVQVFHFEADSRVPKLKVDHLPSGTYSLHLQQEGITHRLRFVKQ
ncbi:T9SS type A sorting domain-containing protein [Nibribacter ruber]|uniref:T9SS type A sorting domain-containing protein n=1 Tax=Nibribacter ruber TaxID=2698458 RepID=A0A6P1P409_9BACT|nr:T9SS type A sorting domain-containing protein [Nibribacter ruber]QHL89169.1 T9SS type A sorting domain-containing protein [Nibribacter ruber]